MGHAFALFRNFYWKDKISYSVKIYNFYFPFSPSYIRPTPRRRLSELSDDQPKKPSGAW